MDLLSLIVGVWGGSGVSHALTFIADKIGNKQFPNPLYVLAMLLAGPIVWFFMWGKRK